MSEAFFLAAGFVVIAVLALYCDYVRLSKKARNTYEQIRQERNDAERLAFKAEPQIYATVRQIRRVK